jgi:hypothetical protein
MRTAFSKIVRPTTDIKGNVTLDFRAVPKQGRDLYDLIIESVAHTQRFIVQTLPNKLIVTQKQFASLNNFTQAMYNTTDRFMITPLNAMEVTIDRDIDLVEQIEDVMVLNDQIDEILEQDKLEEVSSDKGN